MVLGVLETLAVNWGRWIGARGTQHFRGFMERGANTNGLCSQGVCVSWESAVMTRLFLHAPCQEIPSSCSFAKEVELITLIVCFIELVVVQVFEHPVHGAAGAMCKNISCSLSAEILFHVP